MPTGLERLMQSRERTLQRRGRSHSVGHKGGRCPRFTRPSPAGAHHPSPGNGYGLAGGSRVVPEDKRFCVYLSPREMLSHCGPHGKLLGPITTQE